MRTWVRSNGIEFCRKSILKHSADWYYYSLFSQILFLYIFLMNRMMPSSSQVYFWFRKYLVILQVGRMLAIYSKVWVFYFSLICMMLTKLLWSHSCSWNDKWDNIDVFLFPNSFYFHCQFWILLAFLLVLFYYIWWDSIEISIK